MVTTPDGLPVAMVHCNTCTSDVNAWVRLLGEVLEAYGLPVNRDEMYVRFYTLALQGDPDAGGLTTFNYYSGEPVTETTEVSCRTL